MNSVRLVAYTTLTLVAFAANSLLCRMAIKENELSVTAIMDHLSDMLFLYIIRHTLHVNPRLSPLLIAMADNHLQLATQALIKNPAGPWTVDALARKACLSRSALPIWSACHP